MLAPANTPKETLATLFKAIVEASKVPQLQEGFAKQLVSVKPSESLDEAQTWLNGELANWRKITAEVKIDLTDGSLTCEWRLSSFPRKRESMRPQRRLGPRFRGDDGYRISTVVDPDAESEGST